MNLLLTRTESNSDGTFGELYVPMTRRVADDAADYGGQHLHTVEDDWLLNRRGISCIPAGEYTLKRTVFYKHGYETFEVTGVPNRTRILIHPANTEEDIEGCIGVGLRRGKLVVHDEDNPAHPLVEKQAVVASREAFRRFMEWMAPWDEATLVVQWVPGLP
jgi:hypothetical protein